MEDKIYIKDNDFLGVDIKTQLTDELKYTVEHYLYGRCHLFSLKLNEITQLEPVMFCHYGMYQYFLRHAACIINDEYVVDASGIRTYESVINEYLKDNEDFSKDMIRILKGDKALQILKDCTESGEYYPFDSGEPESLSKYINMMNQNGLLTLNNEKINLEIKKDTKIKNKIR